MTIADLASRAVKAVLAVASAIIVDYAVLNGRMTRQVVSGIERAAADAPLLLDRVVTSLANVKL